MTKYVAKTNIQGPGPGQTFEPGDEIPSDLTKQQLAQLLEAGAIEETSEQKKDKADDSSARPKTVTVPLPGTTTPSGGAGGVKAQPQVERPVEKKV